MTYSAAWINRSDINSMVVEIELMLTDDANEMPTCRIPYSFDLPCEEVNTAFLDDIAATAILNATNDWNSRNEAQINLCKKKCADLAADLRAALVCLEEITPVKNENSILLADLEEFQGRI
jgi:hypothetical protein